MKHICYSVCLALLLSGCAKDKVQQTESAKEVNCNLAKALQDNPGKVTISRGVWGTISSMEGDCSPTIDNAPRTCSNCQVQRKVQVFAKTYASQAITPDDYNQFYDAFRTNLVAEVLSDEQGFFQISLPPGEYTIVLVEDGKLHALQRDDRGWLGPLTITGNEVVQLDLVMTYKAVF